MKWGLVSSPMKQLKGHKEMGSNCTGEGLNSILEKNVSGKGLPSIGAGCQGKWVHYYPWRYLTCATFEQGLLINLAVLG